MSVSKANFYELNFYNDLRIVINPKDVNLLELKKYIDSKSKIICLCNGALRIDLDKNTFTITGVKLNENSYFVSKNSSDLHDIIFTRSKSDILTVIEYYIHLSVENSF
jgi:hypothetical protein